MNDAHSTVFPTKVDLWLIVVLVTALGVEVYAAFFALSQVPNDPFTRYFVVGGLVFPMAIVALVALPTRYELHADELLIRSGVIRYHVPYRDIVQVHPSHNLLSAPAWSLDRLKVCRTQGYALISPRDKDAFLRALQHKAPHLRLDGDRLMSTPAT